ncbi:glycosyltransferase family 2 protein [Henriciella litoralis]|uniref:glycosyltransferase family 2 protein n=1 Tax=Henriciella litoralis TaxID=568102 RepID=UPI0009FD3EB3|nr:glycosyltransferase family 2 protein [Henriciella litoralis]
MGLHTQALKTGVIIPTYRHVSRLAGILDLVVEAGLPVLVIDDGNAPDDRNAIIAACTGRAGVQCLHRNENGGKGSAVKDGLLAALAKGWTHAIQLDADGQHDTSRLGDLVSLAETHPNHVICAVPVYDETIPKARKIGREITHFWVRVETLSNEISDSMCGLRVYPLEETCHVVRREFIGARMDFDTEILVQLNWRGLRIIELPVRVTYPEENISNFRMLQDNIRISLMHTRLSVQAPFRVPIRMLRRRFIKRYQRAEPAG